MDAGVAGAAPFVIEILLVNGEPMQVVLPIVTLMVPPANAEA